MSDNQSKKVSFAGFIAEAIQTREVRSGIDAVITEIINQWEAGNTLKSIISNPAKWIVNKSFSKPEDVHQNTELLSLIKRLDITGHISVIIPVLINRLSETFHTIAVSLENASFNNQKKFFENLLLSVDPAIQCKAIASFAKASDAIHAHHPTFFSEKTIPGIKNFIENTDFGVLRKFVDNSEEDIKSLIEGLNDLIVAFPGKLITGLSFIPVISNHIVFYLKDVIERLNRLPADILTDILISLFKDVDTKTMGGLVNHVNELIRQIHTGSALIGESGAPQFSSDLLDKMSALINEIDKQLLLKAGNAVIDGKEVLQKTFYTVLNNDPELLKAHLQHLIVSYNSNITVLKQKLEIIEALNDDDDTETLSSVVSEINACDLAETINTSLFILNVLQENSPKTIQKVISEFMNTLDLDEIENALETIILENITQFRPFLRTTFPIIIEGFIACLSSEHEDNNERIDTSINKLRQFIMGKEM